MAKWKWQLCNSACQTLGFYPTGKLEQPYATEQKASDENTACCSVAFI